MVHICIVAACALLIGGVYGIQADLSVKANGKFVVAKPLNPKPGLVGSYLPDSEASALADLTEANTCVRLDAQGVPVVQYQSCVVDDVPRKPLYNPGTVANFALGLWDLGHRTKLFLVQANWLLAHQNRNGDFPVGFPIPQLGLKSGWISAMYQGQAISVFLRAYQATKQVKYLRAATRALLAFRLPYGHGGVVAKTPWGPLPQEYAGPSPPSVLNGAITAIIGLLEYAAFTDDSAVREQALQYCKTIDHMLPRLTVPGWAKYQGSGNDEASVNYMALQTEELGILGAYAGDPEMLSYSTTWRSDFNWPREWAAPLFRAVNFIYPSGWRRSL